MTGQDLIDAALKTLGVLAAGETATAEESIDALLRLNDLIDSWSTENLLIPSKLREVFDLSVPSFQQTYTMGVGGNFNTPRPMKLENVNIQLTAQSPVVEIPMEIMNQDEYAGVILKTIQSAFPLSLYADNAFPLCNISVWPVPTAACSLVTYSWKPLTEIATLTTALSLPPGYQRALRLMLAVELAAEFGKALPPELTTMAGEAKATIKRMNTQAKYLRVDNALQAQGRVYNWRTDGYER